MPCWVTVLTAIICIIVSVAITVAVWLLLIKDDSQLMCNACRTTQDDAGQYVTSMVPTQTTQNDAGQYVTSKEYYFSMDKIEGEILIGYGIQGRVYGATLVRSPCKKGSCLLVKIGEYVDLGYHGDKCLGNCAKCQNGLSAAVWVKVYNSEWNTVISSNMANVVTAFGFAIYVRDSGHGVELQSYSGSRRWKLQYTLPYSPHDWCHIGMTWHEQHGLKLYVNGQHAKTLTTTTHIALATANENFFVGKNSLHMVNGLVDEVYIWQEEKDASVMQHVYNDVFYK